MKTLATDFLARLPPRLESLAFILILSLGVMALCLSWISVSNYVDSIQSIRRLTLIITDLQFIDDNNPRVQVQFRLHNPSSLAMQVNSYFFELSVNEHLVGTTSSSYRGTDATVNVSVYSQATRINRILEAGQSLDLDFTLYIAPAQQTLVRQAEQANNPTWLADTGFWLVFPHVVEEDLIRLKVEFEH